MTAIVNGIQYIGGGTAPDEFIKNQAGTIDGTQTVENGVLSRTYYYTWYNNSNRDFSNSIMSKIEVNAIDTTMRSTLNIRWIW